MTTGYWIDSVNTEFMGGGNMVVEAKLVDAFGSELYAVYDGDGMTVNRLSLVDPEAIEHPEVLDQPLYSVQSSDCCNFIEYEDANGMLREWEYFDCGEWEPLRGMMAGIWSFYRKQGLV